jgi:hypothetical protein
MTPLIVVSLITEALRLINNIIEGKSPELRQAEALVGWALFKPIVWPLLPEETKREITKLMEKPVVKLAKPVAG